MGNRVIEIKIRKVHFYIFLFLGIIALISLPGLGISGVSHDNPEIMNVSSSKILPGIFGANLGGGNYEFVNLSLTGRLFSNRIKVNEINSSGTLKVKTNNLSIEGSLIVKAGDLYGNGSGIYDISMSRPYYDSGWISINKNQIIELTPGLGGTADNYFVQMFGKRDNLVHQRFYGGLTEINTTNTPTVGLSGHTSHCDCWGGAYYWWWDTYNTTRGAYWYNLTSAGIFVKRMYQDEDWQQFRVLIWKHG